MLSTALGIILLVTGNFIYVRYATSNLHADERLQYAMTLNVIWR